MSSPPAPAAATITIRETLALLDTTASGLGQGVANGRYAFWLGSGVSFGRVPGLREVVIRVVEFLRVRAVADGPGSPHAQAFDEALEMAALRDAEREAVELAASVDSWPCREQVINGLIGRYSQLLDIRVPGEREDYLLWEAVDVRATYGAPGSPGAGHLCLAILGLEGVVSDVPSANWDRLVEVAVAELAQRPADVLTVAVLPDDFRTPRRRTRLLKFHGCAALAGEDEGTYRPRLVGSRSRITEWPSDPDWAMMRDELQKIATEKPTLMLGLSAQDTDIQDIFSKAKAQMQWPWPSDPPAYVFAEDELGDMQHSLLKVVYRAEYEAHGQEIDESAVVQAYAETLLVALVLYVIAAKLEALIRAVDGPSLEENDRRPMCAGVGVLRDKVANGDGHDRFAFVTSLIRVENKAMSLFKAGEQPVHDAAPYRPLTSCPADQVANEPTLETAGLREMAAALGLLGSGEQTGVWNVTLGAVASGIEGALRIETNAGREAAVFFAATGRASVGIESLDAVLRAPGDAIVIHSTQPVARGTRSPHGTYGRTGRAAIRNIDMSDILSHARDSVDLHDRFRLAVTL